MDSEDKKTLIATINLYQVESPHHNVPFHAEIEIGEHKHSGSGYFVEQALRNATAPMVLNYLNPRQWSEDHNKFMDKLAKRREENEFKEKLSKLNWFQRLFKVTN